MAEKVKVREIGAILVISLVLFLPIFYLLEKAGSRREASRDEPRFRGAFYMYMNSFGEYFPAEDSSGFDGSR